MKKKRFPVGTRVRLLDISLGVGYPGACGVTVRARRGEASTRSVRVKYDDPKIRGPYWASMDDLELEMSNTMPDTRDYLESVSSK